jgi:hypothetical protein
MQIITAIFVEYFFFYCTVSSTDGKETMKVEYVSLSMKVLFVSRIGLSEGDLDKYMNDAIGGGFELAEWFAYS